MFWRPKRDEAPPGAAPEAPPEATPEAAPPGAGDEFPVAAPQPKPDALWGPGIGPPPADVRPALDAGLARTRGTFVTTLRGFLGADGDTAWDEVEETLIAGDVGATLAMAVVERARRRHEPGA